MRKTDENQVRQVTQVSYPDGITKNTLVSNINLKYSAGHKLRLDKKIKQLIIHMLTTSKEELEMGILLNLSQIPLRTPAV